LPKRLKSGKKSAEIEEWDSETNGPLIVIPFGTCEKIVPVEDSPNVPLSISEAHRIADKTYPWKRTLSILRSSFE
jgi:hypothetical protein